MLKCEKWCTVWAVIASLNKPDPLARCLHPHKSLNGEIASFERDTDESGQMNEWSGGIHAVTWTWYAAIAYGFTWMTAIWHGYYMLAEVVTLSRCLVAMLCGRE